MYAERAYAWMTGVVKNLVERLKNAIRQKDSKAAHSVLRDGLVADGETFLEMARGKGAFRYSSYGYETKLISSLVSAARASSAGALSERTKDYLDSLQALAFIADDVRSRFRRVRNAINPRSFIAYLATVENLFLNDHVPETGVPRSDWRQFSKEKLASAFSYYYALLVEKDAPKPRDLGFIFERKIRVDYYLSVLTDLAKIVSYKEAEFLVEIFSYRAVRDRTVVDINPSDDRFEMSVRWGYIYSEEQQKADSHHLRNLQLPSLREGGVLLAKEIFEVKREPVERIVMNLPMIDSFVEMIKGDLLHREDLIALKRVERELFITPAAVKSTPIWGSITLFDLIKFQRLWLLWMAAFQEYCKSNGFIGAPVYFRSIVHFFYKGGFQVISAFWDEKKTKELFTLLSWDPSKNKVFDVQYAPIIKVEGGFAVATGILATSRLARNVLQSTRFRFDTAGEADPLGEMLAGALAKNGVLTKRKVAYSYGPLSGEVDVLAAAGDTLFVFECKLSLHPCCPFELRQSFEYLSKGFEQLTRIRNLLTDSKFVRLIEAKTGLSLMGIRHVKTCVVMGNTMFNGYTQDGHSVRNVYELCNLIETGTATVSIFDHKALRLAKNGVLRMRFWNGSSFDPDDLTRCLDSNPFHESIFAAMREHFDTTCFGGRQMRLKTYYLDQVAWVENFRHRSNVEFVEQQSADNRS